MKEVKSSNISKIGHSGTTLTVEFKNGGAVWDYEGVTPEQHDALVNADSIGSHFHHHIKSKFEGKKREENK